MAEDGCCELCGRRRPLTIHHLIPRQCQKNKWFRKRFSREEMQSRVAQLCRPCHDFVHATWTEKELGRSFADLALIRAEARTQRFLGWIRRQR